MGGQGFVLLYRRLLIAITLGLWVGLVVPDEALTPPRGQTFTAADTSLALIYPAPVETPATGTPDVLLCALRDALIKPSPANAMIPYLVESWTKSTDSPSTAFKRREGLMFHNEVMGLHRLRSPSTEPWPDMLANYGTPATGVAGVVLKQYREYVEDDGFNKHPKRKEVVARHLRCGEAFPVDSGQSS
jgi:peptide/nickel transport system substrate-binding protein